MREQIKTQFWIFNLTENRIPKALIRLRKSILLWVFKIKAIHLSNCVPKTLVKVGLSC